MEVPWPKEKGRVSFDYLLPTNRAPRHIASSVRQRPKPCI